MCCKWFHVKEHKSMIYIYIWIYFDFYWARMHKNSIIIRLTNSMFFPTLITTQRFDKAQHFTLSHFFFLFCLNKNNNNYGQIIINVISFSLTLLDKQFPNGNKMSNIETVSTHINFILQTFSSRSTSKSAFMRQYNWEPISYVWW